jgi:hypothetical protein
MLVAQRQGRFAGMEQIQLVIAAIQKKNSDVPTGGTPEFRLLRHWLRQN